MLRRRAFLPLLQISGSDLGSLAGWATRSEGRGWGALYNTFKSILHPQRDHTGHCFLNRICWVANTSRNLRSHRNKTGSSIKTRLRSTGARGFSHRASFLIQDLQSKGSRGLSSRLLGPPLPVARRQLPLYKSLILCVRPAVLSLQALAVGTHMQEKRHLDVNSARSHPTASALYCVLQQRAPERECSTARMESICPVPGSDGLDTAENEQPFRGSQPGKPTSFRSSSARRKERKEAGVKEYKVTLLSFTSPQSLVIAVAAPSA